MVATQFPPNSGPPPWWECSGLVVGLTYFPAAFIVPLTGNRFYCRYLCRSAPLLLAPTMPVSGIEMDTEQCVDCRRCEQTCDMGIPVWSQGRETGKSHRQPGDCMGYCALHHLLSHGCTGDTGCAQPAATGTTTEYQPSAEAAEPTFRGGARASPGRPGS